MLHCEVRHRRRNCLAKSTAHQRRLNMRKTFRRCLFSLAMTTAAITVGHQLGFTYPGNVFRTATPAQAPTLEDKINSEEESHSVSESGASQYTIPITVPPGRQ